MADNVSASGNTVAADEVVDGTLGTVKVQYVKLMDGTLDSATKIAGGANGLKVDPSGVTSPVSIAGSVTVTQASQPLPAGAATSSKQPALGTAGTPSADVLTVQGTASMTALKVDPSAVTSPISAASLPLPTGAASSSNQTNIQGTFGSITANKTVLYDSSGVVIDFTASSPVINIPRAAANGATSTRVVAAASTNATSLKASAGNIVNIDVFNVAAYDVYLKFYNKASSPTVGTDTPVWTIPLKAGTGFSREFVQGKSFSTGIALAITKLQADSDTTVLVAGDVTGAIDWV